MVTLLAIAFAVAWIVLTLRPVFSSPKATEERTEDARERADRATVVVLLGPNPLADALVGDDEVLVVQPDPGLHRARALDWALAEAAGHPFLVGRRAEDVAFIVIEGRDVISRTSLLAATRCLDAAEVGAAQPSVRIHRPRGLLARLQDLDCIGGNEFYLRRSPALGALGLGPAAPAYRWGAVAGIGGWPVGPADDVEVAARLIPLGWRAIGCPAATVGRPAVVGLRALIVHRSRVMASMLRSARHAPAVFRRGGSDGASGAAALLAPTGLLLVSVALLVLAVAASANPDAAERAVFGADGTRVVAWYAVVFAPAWVAGITYWLRQGETGVPGAVLFGHLFVLYSLLWIPIAWIGLALALGGPSPAPAPGRVKTEPQ